MLFVFIVCLSAFTIHYNANFKSTYLRPAVVYSKLNLTATRSTLLIDSAFWDSSLSEHATKIGSFDFALDSKCLKMYLNYFWSRIEDESMHHLIESDHCQTTRELTDTY